MKEYFASVEADRLAGDLYGKVDNYYQWLMMSGRLARMRMAFDSYYGQRSSHNSQFVRASGEKGELSFLMANEYRNLVQHLHVLATQNRPSIECAAVNTDRVSEEQAISGKQILDYYRKEGGIDKGVTYALEIALLFDMSWVFTTWNTQKGNPVRPDMSGNIVTDGDVESRARTALDVVIDYTRDHGLEDDWQIERDLVNKYDLAAQFPEKAEDIIGIERDRSKDYLYRFGDQNMFGFSYADSPLIERWTFYHKKSPAMPQGRMFQFLNPKVWLFDGPIPYKRLPGRRCCPTEMIQSALGYSNCNDLLALQDVMDSLVSAAVTNMTSVGVNNIWNKPNSNLDFERLGEGMNYLESENKPEVLILNKLPPEWFNLANWIVARMEAYSGVNSVARGNTEGKDFSGAAMALLQSMAIQFNSGVQRAYTQLIEDVNNDALSLLQDFAKNPKTALILGENNKYMMKSFSAASFDKIQRVYCRQSNSMQDTTAGKMTLADKLLTIPNAITSADQYLEVLQTGQLTPMLEDKNKMLMAIRDENESLAQGKPVQVVMIENHPRHIMGHAANIQDPDSKLNKQLVQSTLAHIQEHINEWQNADPRILQALGIPPLPPMPMPGMPGQPPSGGPQGPGASPMPDSNGPPSGPQGQPSIEPPPAPNGPAPQAKGPSMPTNPLSKEKFNPQTGGLPTNG